MTEREIPRIIYLQWHGYESIDDGVTWCEDQIHEDDLRYRISSTSGPWDDVLKALDALYHQWAEDEGECESALDDLMQAYDRWLD